MNIPVAKPFLNEREVQAAAQVILSGWITQGPRVAEFENAFAEYVGSRYAIAVSSCTTALHLSMYALGIGPGDEVICPSYSFIATANSIVQCGARPVFVDIDPKTYNLNPALILAALTLKTKAIMPVHQVGMPAPMQEIMAIAKAHHLLVIEDAACAIGSHYCGIPIGKPFGDAVCFSFHPRKLLTTGDGGMITTEDADLAARLKRLRQHAMSVPDTTRHTSKEIFFETYDEIGYNYRMTDIQAAVGLEQLKQIPEFLHVRRTQAKRYTDAFSKVKGLHPPYVPDYAYPNYQSYILRLEGNVADRRNDLMEYLLKRGIATRRGVMCIHREKAYESNTPVLPESEQAVDSTLILPLYHTMTIEEQDFVISAVFEAVNSF